MIQALKRVLPVRPDALNVTYSIFFVWPGEWIVANVLQGDGLVLVLDRQIHDLILQFQERDKELIPVENRAKRSVLIEIVKILKLEKKGRLSKSYF